MSESSKPTPGPWAVDSAQAGDLYRYVYAGNDETFGYVCRLSLNGNANTEADARLIAEAGTVFHERGLTPRGLVEQIDLLREALKSCLDYGSMTGDVWVVHKACAALANTERKTS